MKVDRSGKSSRWRVHGLLPVLGLAIVIIGLGGCLAPKSYVDPAYASAEYSDITRRSQPYRLEIIVEFQKSGEHYEKGDGVLKDQVERIVRATYFAVPATDNTDGSMRIVLNNFGDKGQAIAKGIGTGLTFGMVGSMVTDYYEMEAELTLAGETIRKATYQHAIHSTIGRKEGPEGLEPMTLMEAFGDVVEDLILNFIRDVQVDMQESSMRLSPGSAFTADSGITLPFWFAAAGSPCPATATAKTV